MGLNYRAVGWNRQKRTYDRVVALAVVGYLALFVGGGFVLFPDATPETLLIRGLGTCAYLLLHVILVIGPLTRLDPRFLPLLYNRRHLGVAMFLLALGHGAFALLQFHFLGDANPLVHVLVSGLPFEGLAQFPFQPLGVLALGLLFLMAATSHDFWLANLTAPVWKTLHMGVYVAYAALVGHVSLGVLQSELHPAWAGLQGLGLAAVFGLHLVAGARERARDRERGARTEDGWVDLCALSDIREGRAHVATVGGERVAVFRHAGQLSALSSVCQHQNGPLGEGRVIDGLVTCPWHGYQYHPCSGRAPEPFHEAVPTFRVRLEGTRVQVDPRPLPPGTEVEPARFPEEGTP